jgi:hypothetical protein
MLWIFNKKLLSQDFIFYQIFNTNNIYHDDNHNIIYNFQNKDSEDYKDFKNIKINYQIKIMGNIIMYKNLDDNEILTFTKKETSNNIDNLVLTYEYKIVDNHKLPELTSYDFYYSHLEFNIYYKNYDKLFIIQNNKSNNTSMNYWIQQSLI